MLGKDGVEVEHGFHFGRGKDPTTPEGHSQRKFKFPECSIKPATSLKPQQRKKFIVNLSNFNVHYKRFNIYKRTIVFPIPVNKLRFYCRPPRRSAFSSASAAEGWVWGPEEFAVTVMVVEGVAPILPLCPDTIEEVATRGLEFGVKVGLNF